MSGIPVSRDPDDMDMHHIHVHQELAQDKGFLDMMQVNPGLMMVLQAHYQAHVQAIQQQSAMMAGVAPSQGMGSGMGAAGASMGFVGPDEQTAGELEAQAQKESERVEGN